MAVEDHRVVIGVDYTGQADVQKYLSDLARMAQGSADARRRIEQAMSGQLPLLAGTAARTPPALPAGSGAQDASIARAQADYIRALNERSRALTRAQGFQQRVNSIIDNPGSRGVVAGAAFDERTGAIRALEFSRNLEDGSRSLRTLKANLDRLNAQIAAQQTAFNPTTTQVNAAARSVNEPAIQAHLAHAINNNPTTGGQHQIDELGQILAGLKGVVQKALFNDGLVKYQLAARLNPEMREVLTGTSDHPRYFGQSTGDIVAQIPGTIDTTAMRRQMQAEAVDPKLYERHAAAQALHDRAMEQQARYLEQRGSRIALGPARAPLALESADMQAQRAEQARAAERAAFQASLRYHVTGENDKFGIGRVVAEHPTHGLIGAMFHGLEGKPNTIDEIGVLPQFRRMGVASAMFQAAIDAGKPIQHSPDRTGPGDAFARSVGGHLPERRPVPDDYLSTDTLQKALDSIAAQRQRLRAVETRAQASARADQAALGSSGSSVYALGAGRPERQAAYDTQRDSASFPRVGLPRPPDVLNGLYHGATNALPGQLLPASQVPASKGQMYGQGLYLTDNAEIARSYATHETGYGQLHEMTRASGRSKVYDMAQELTPEEVARLRQRITRTPEEDAAHINALMGTGSSTTDALGRPIAPVTRSFPSYRVKDMLDMFKGGDDWGIKIPPSPVTFQKLFEGLGDSRVAGTGGDHEWLTKYIQETTGANVLRYQGGQYTGGDIKHNAYVVLDPENMRTKSISPWSMHDEAEQKALAQRQADAAARGPATFAHAAPAGRPFVGALAAGQSGPQAAALAQQARAAQEAAQAETQVSKALVHVRDLVTETYPEYEKARLAVESRARAEEQAARAAVSSGNALRQGGSGRAGAGGAGAGSGSGGGGGGGTPPPATGGHREGDDAHMHRAAQTWWEKIDEETRAMRPSAFDDVFRAQSRLARATDHSADVMAKGNIGIGEEGGFKTEDARSKAYRSASEAEQAAAKNLASAEKRLAEAMAKEAAARERRTAPVDTGQVHGPGMPLDEQTAASVRNTLASNGALSAVQAAQQNLAQAQNAQAAATKAHQQVINGTYANQQQAATAYATSLGNMTRSQQAVQQAQQNLAAATQTATKTANNAASGGGAGGAGGSGGGGGGGFFAAFGKGFRGNPETPIAAQLGQTARFSVFYGSMYRALFLLTQTLQNAVTEGIAFEDAMTNLSIAAGRPKEELTKLGAQLGQESVRAGFAPSQGIEIGARSLGLYGVAGAGADPEQQRQVARTSARVVSQLAVGSGKTPVELQGDIGAIAQALGLGAGGQQRIADLDAYMTKKFGVQQGSTLQAVSESASVGKAAGFSNPQLFAISADMISRTGQTPSAVAGYMAQIFSRGGEGSLVNVAQGMGIDPNQNLSKIVEQLSALYKSADPRQQAQISAAFGRGKVQNAAVALLGDYSQVQAASRQGVTGADGAANKQFEQHMKNIGGQLRELGGEFRLFAQELGQAGLLDGLAAMALVLKGLVGAANTLLGMFIQLPRPLRDAAIGLALFAAASKMGIVSGVGSKLLAAGAAGSNLVPMVGPLAAGATRPLVTASGQAAGFGAAAATAGKGLLRIAGPIGLAIGGLMAIASVKASIDRMKAAQDDATAAIRAGGALNPNTSTAEDFRSHAAELRAQADQNRAATGWFTNAITFGHADDANQATARQLDAEAKRLGQVAAGIKEPGQGAPPMFQSLGAADIKSGLDQITQSGGTAQTQLKSLRDVLYATAGAAKSAAEAFDPKKFAGRAVSGLQADGLGAIAGLGTLGRKSTDDAYGGKAGSEGITLTGPGKHGAVGGVAITGKDVLNNARSVLDGRKMQRLLEQQLQSRGIRSEGDLGPDQAHAIAQAMAGPAADDLIKQVGPSIAGSRNKIMRAFQQAWQARLLADAKKQRNLLKGNTKLSDLDATGLADDLTAASEQRLGDLGTTDNKGRIAELRQRIQDLHKINSRRSGGGVLPDILLKLSQARAELVDSQLSEIDNVRRAAMANARTRAAATAAGQSALQQSIHAIVKNGNADQLATLLAGAGREANAMARKAIADSIAVERAALEAEKELSSAAAAVIAANPSLNKPRVGPDGEQGGKGRDPAGEVRKGLNKRQKAIQREIDRLNKMDAALNTPGVGPKDDKYKASGIDVYNPYWNNDKNKSKKDESELEKLAAQQRAAAAASRSPVAAARAQMTTARAAMQRAAKENGKNSVEYWDAVGQYNDAQNQLADAMASIPAAKASAWAARNGGQIAQARAGLVAARMQMKTAEGDQAAYFQGLAALYQSQWALRQALEAYRKNVMLLHVDMTNPLRQAQVETRAAAMKLRDDARHGAGRDVIVQDKVDLRTARANQESTAFQQRLQAVQTADNLGRITHQTYMNYLSHEHDRLSAVRHRTYQQQQELDQIDGLMKDAAQQMQGQFNIGDIKLPTPYQVRRYIKSQAQGLTASGTPTAVTTNNVSMTFQGYDPKQIEKTVAKVVGKSARTMTTAARRR